MSFYVYENWTAEHKAVIHRGSCGNCQYGAGCHHNLCGNKNGQWLGPFKTYDEAISVANKTGRKVRSHKCI